MKATAKNTTVVLGKDMKRCVSRFIEKHSTRGIYDKLKLHLFEIDCARPDRPEAR